MVTRILLALTTLCTLASAQEAGKAAGHPLPPTRSAAAHELEPSVHHAPPSSARAHETLAVVAQIEHPHLVKRALVVYRSRATTELREVEMLRASDGPYRAEVPAEHVIWPSLAYTIELELLTGQRIAAFASREAPFEVQVPEDLTDVRERTLAKRLGGRRSQFAAGGEYVDFGRSRLQEAPGVTVRDRYYRIEGSYTYRPLRVVTEFSIKLGLVRGTAPVPVRELVPGQKPEERYEVGLNYGAPTVRFRFHDQIHFEAELLSSITEQGFAVGTGGALLLGDPYGKKLTFGFETIQGFGSRFFSRVDVTATEGLTLAPVIEVTNMPSADSYGVRLLGELGMELGGGFDLAVRGGYQARLATSGGPSGGAVLRYAF